VLNLCGTRFRIGLNVVNTPTEVEPPKYKPIEEQTQECYRAQVPQEIPVTDARKRPNQDVLWVASDGRGTSDV